MAQQTGCPWATGDALMQHYHDVAWGMPVHDDRQLFEQLILEGAQAGLSWRTVLHKRANYRELFAGFDTSKLLAFTPMQKDGLLMNPGIIRNRLKVKSVFINAACFMEVQNEFGSFNAYIWSFTSGKTINNNISLSREIPSQSSESRLMSKDLKKRGFKFVGTTICYAFMQAVGMVNDHLINCPRHADINDQRNLQLQPY